MGKGLGNGVISSVINLITVLTVIAVLDPEVLEELGLDLGLDPPLGISCEFEAEGWIVTVLGFGVADIPPADQITDVDLR